MATMNALWSGWHGPSYALVIVRYSGDEAT